MPTLHQAEHLPGVAAHVEGFPVEVAGERIQRSHDVADGAIAMITGVRRLGVVRLLQHRGIGLGDHLFAVIDPDEILLEDVVVEHVLRSLAEVDDPLTDMSEASPRTPCSGSSTSTSHGCRRRFRRSGW